MQERRQWHKNTWAAAETVHHLFQQLMAAQFSILGSSVI
jgi:hypothetical protein